MTKDGGWTDRGPFDSGFAFESCRSIFQASGIAGSYGVTEYDTTNERVYRVQHCIGTSDSSIQSGHVAFHAKPSG